MVTAALALSCGGPVRRTPAAEVDACLGDRAAPLDPKPIAAAWDRLSVQLPPESLPPLRRFSRGRCVESWWKPVEPIAICREPLAFRMLPMADAGTVVLGPNGFMNHRPPGTEVSELDGYLVTRTEDEVRVERAGSPTGRASYLLPGAPARIVDARRAIVTIGNSVALYDYVVGTKLLDIAPAPAGANDYPRVSETVAMKAPGGRYLYGGIAAREDEWESFVIDERGTPIASVRAPVGQVGAPMVTLMNELVLVGYRDQTLEIVTVTETRKVSSRTVPFDAGTDAGTLRFAATADAVVASLGRRAAIVRRDQAPLTLSIPVGEITPLLLHGGNVLVAKVTNGRVGTLVVDTRSGKVLARVQDSEPRYDIQRRLVALIDAKAFESERAIVIDAQGAIKRGPLGEVTVHGFILRSFAGVPDPSVECDAEALADNVKLLEYPGPYYLPAELVKYLGG